MRMATCEWRCAWSREATSSRFGCGSGRDGGVDDRRQRKQATQQEQGVHLDAISSRTSSLSVRSIATCRRYGLPSADDACAATRKNLFLLASFQRHPQAGKACGPVGGGKAPCACPFVRCAASPASARMRKTVVLKFRKAWVPILIAGLLTSSGWSAMAADKALDIAQDDATRAQALPARVTVGFERLRLPGDERVGLLGASYVVELAPGWWLGPALYGAATGRRGGQGQGPGGHS